MRDRQMRPTNFWRWQLVTTCPVCSDVVHTSCGVVVTHGAMHHGVYNVCSGSGSPLGDFLGDCCG